jgi:hypothetical protein
VARNRPSPFQLVLLGVAGAGGMTAVQYFAPGGGDLYPAVVAGLGCGVILPVVVGRTDEALSKPLRPLTVFDVLMIAAGFVLAFLGVMQSDWGLALSGLPFIAIGGGLMAARTLLNRQRGS